jgi:hypothetical protein
MITPTEDAKAGVAELIYREKTTGLSPDEKAELDQYMQQEHLIRLAKARERGLREDEISPLEDQN